MEGLEFKIKRTWKQTKWQQERVKNLNLEDGNDRLSLNFGMELPLPAA
jgi:hypothetical protein